MEAKKGTGEESKTEQPDTLAGMEARLRLFIPDFAIGKPFERTVGSQLRRRLLAAGPGWSG
jgi:hypothetical protein